VTRLIAVITNFAICLFLFALVVTVPPKLRPYFIAVPCIGAALTVGWSIRIWASNVQTPNSAAIEAYVNGNVDFSNGNVQRAIRETSRAITTMAGFEAAYLQRGDAYFYRGDYGKSAADLKTASSLDPQDFSAFNYLAAAYWWLHDYKAAAQAIQRAGRLNPGDPTVVFNEIEGVATTSNDPTAYAGLVKQLESVLRRRGPAAVTDYEGDFDDLAASAADSPAIRVEMQAVCRSLLGLAEPLRIGVENYGCDPLRRPSVSHARFLWRGS
jgi:tetratricopeptide (TPR) repeat protein